MSVTKSRYWCLNGCGKKVFGLEVNKMMKDGKNFQCSLCDGRFSAEELQKMNNMHRVFQNRVKMKSLYRGYAHGEEIHS
jgi:hypothetical protein